MRSRCALLLLIVLIAAACGREPDVSSDRIVSSPETTSSPEGSASPAASATPRRSATATPRSTTRPAVTVAPNLAAADVQLDEIANLSEPVAMATRPGDGTLYIAQKGGVVTTLPGRSTVLDITTEVMNNGEQGLLGLTFSPDGKRMYVYFTAKDSDQVVREYVFSDGKASGARTVLRMDDPFGNHNGGNMLFGPDGYLYIGTGDGGSAGDPGNRAQDTGDLLGKMLRIDPRAKGSAAYSSPSSNPFVGSDGRDEIWAFGLRNPWRFSFDRQTGALWIGDVGQDAWEEINVAPGGSDGGDNYGWRKMEGSHGFNGASPPANHHGPVYEYSHGEGGCSVTGGYVYRGSKIPRLRGAYLFADFCAGRLRAFTLEGGRASGHRFLGPQVGNLASFGEDRNGELYVLSLSGGVYRIVPG